MPFSAAERELLLAVKGVGARMIERLEQQGFASLAALAEADPGEVVSRVAAGAGGMYWKTRPRARQAVEVAVALAKNKTQPE